MRKADNLTTILGRCHVIWEPQFSGTLWAHRACNGTALTCIEGDGTAKFLRRENSRKGGWSGNQIPVGKILSAPVQTGPGAHPASSTMSTGSFPEVKSGRGVLLTSHPLVMPWSRKSRSIPLLPLWTVRSLQSLSACTVELYLYSPYGPYSLYRASVSVQYNYTSTPLSACTVQLYLYSPQYLYSTAIPLLPLWAVQPVQSLSACTVQLYLYCPYGPYGLYKGVLYFFFYYPAQFSILQSA